MKAKTVSKGSLRQDIQRVRESLARIIIGAALCLAIFTFIDGAIYHFFTPHRASSDSFLVSGLFMLLFMMLFLLAIRGHYAIGSSILLLTLFIAGTSIIFRWSINAPTGVLVYALVVVIASVLYGSKGAVASLSLTAVTVGALGFYQANSHIRPDLSWGKEPIQVGDVLVFCCIFIVLGLISWRSNREIEKSVNRASTSEEELQNERDRLEIRVKERTAELMKEQRKRMIELQRFAELGRVSAGLLHDIINPITVAQISLEQVDRQSPDTLAKAMDSIKYIEAYVQSARNQIKRASQIETFEVARELREIKKILSYKARQYRAMIHIACNRDVKLRGELVKFHQIITNLVVNALEALEDTKQDNRIVDVVAESLNTGLKVEVVDAGRGIPQGQEESVFEPFYSTKNEDGRGTGIGLTLVKNTVIDDYKGSISAQTHDGKTYFVVHLADADTSPLE